MQVKSFGSLDEAHKGKGIKSVKKAAALWHAYHNKPEAIVAMAAAIKLVDGEIKSASALETGKPFEAAFAPEGKLLSYQHWRRERNSRLVKRKKEWFLEKYKDIFCEVCDFNYRQNYGARGAGYMECHHAQPLSKGERITKLEDLILICASCHRMIHRKSPWLEVSALKDLILKRPHKR